MNLLHSQKSHLKMSQSINPISSIRLPYPEAGLINQNASTAASTLKKPLLRLGTPLILPPGYECVVLTGVSSIMLLTWKAMKVTDARKQYKVPIPQTYAEHSHIFNCTQRALRSTLDLYPAFLFLLLIGGLEMPYFSSVGGIIWILGRFVYAKGYYTGDVRNRANGTFYFVGHCMLLMSTLKFAFKRFTSSNST